MRAVLGRVIATRYKDKWQQISKDPLFSSALVNVGLILLWYFFSTFLSLWNKMLVGHKDGLYGQGAFPAPFLMSSLQFFAQFGLAKLFLGTNIVRRKSEIEVTWRQYFRDVVPNGVATGLDIGLSNTSLAFITLSFYVMCKSTTPLFLLTFAILWGIEKPSWQLAAVVGVISLGLFLLVAGETQFHLVGFIMVMSASALAGLRWTITQVLLQGDKHTGSRGGAVEILESLTPIMGLTLLLASLMFEKLWVSLPSSPYFSTPVHTLVTMLVLAAGGLIAFCMVWAEFTLIANTSALTFMVAGTLKEIVTVGAAVLFLHEEFTAINALGLVVLIAGVVLFNYFKYQKIKKERLDALAEHELAEYEVDSVSGEAERATLLRTTTDTDDNGPQRSSSSGSSPHIQNNINHRKVFVLEEDERDVFTMKPHIEK